eukprot:11165049-Lingulodinium_polyedra.AAC.1
MARPRVADAGPPGPPPPGCHDLQRVGAELACAASGRPAKRARWTALAYSNCPLSQAGPDARAPWRR